MAGVRKKPNKGGKFQGWYVDLNGKQKFFTGTSNRRETLRMAEHLEDEHRQVRLGYREPPKSSDKHKGRSFSEVLEFYLSWGRSQGGRGGRPWSQEHARVREYHLGWWQDRLDLQTLGDLNDILP